MRFSRKVFISIFVSTLLVSSTLIWVAHLVVARKAEENYLARYTVFSHVLGRTLSQLEQNTESLMFNAAQVVAHEDSSKGLLSAEYLKQLRARLSVTHIFVTNSKGDFIRSTNEDPKRIPNLFSFCGQYRDLISGEAEVKGTPIIPPHPEPKPYKFLTVANRTRNRLIEVGVRVDFIGKTLSAALKDDPNVQALHLHAPDGTTLGSFGRGGVDYGRSKVQLPDKIEATLKDSAGFRIFVKVDSSQPHCCQCDVAGISKAGNYYYVIESVVTDKELIATLASIKKLFIFLQALAALIALLAAKAISKRLVAKVDLVTSKVRALGEARDVRGRIGLTGKDEISFLANEFDGLLDRLEKSQDDLLKSRQEAAVGELAHEVAHNVAAPVGALEMILPLIKETIRDEHWIILNNAATEIGDMVQRLRKQSEYAKASNGTQAPIEGLSEKTEDLWELASDAVLESRISLGHSSKASISLKKTVQSQEFLSCVNATEFKVVINNLIRNSVEALDRDLGSIEIRFDRNNGTVTIRVTDTGKGIPGHRIGSLGEKGATFEKVGGSGIGLYHARTMISAWGGELDISSKINFGTTVTIKLPVARKLQIADRAKPTAIATFRS